MTGQSLPLYFHREIQVFEARHRTVNCESELSRHITATKDATGRCFRDKGIVVRFGQHQAARRCPKLSISIRSWRESVFPDLKSEDRATVMLTVLLDVCNVLEYQACNLRIIAGQ